VVKLITAPFFVTSFGAMFAGEETGIIYNNEMDDFSTPGVRNFFNLEPSEANFIQPGKRPLSSMSPIIVVDNKNQVRLVLGASGGSQIVTSVAQVIRLENENANGAVVGLNVVLY
jgi:gamma-glutamyltranspeptidase/glutathione hydrolase/leukotriene-C4 hydrolase